MKPRPFRIPYRRGSVWWVRLPTADGSNGEVSLGLRDEHQACYAVAALGACYHGLLWQRELVSAVARRDLSVAQFLEAYQQQDLNGLATRVANPDPDLNRFVDGWQDFLRSRGRTSEGSRAKYLQQVRALVPNTAPFPASRFTKRTISSFLSGLQVSAPNRYRAALSSFGRFLVEREIIPFNPVRDVQSAKENAPRMRFLSRDEAKRLVDAISPAEARVMHALMCGSGIEIGAVLALRYRDIDLQSGTVQAHGTKRLDRDRSVFVTEPWCWQIVSEWLCAQTALPNATVFRLGYYGATDALKRGLKAVGIENYRSHDWRHTYAVQALKDDERPEVVAHQLGHKNAAMVHAVYGRYVPKPSDYRAKLTFGLTVLPGNAAIRSSKRAIR